MALTLPAIPLANVRYDNRFDVSLGMAYAHIMAGPTLQPGFQPRRPRSPAPIGSASTGVLRAPVAAISAPAAPWRQHLLPTIKGPFVAQYIFAGGPEWLGPHNKHGALIAHVLVGGAYGDFEKGFARPASLGGRFL
jgi:hypothetical protein